MTPNFKSFLVFLTVLFCCVKVFAGNSGLKMENEPFGPVPYGVQLQTPSAAAFVASTAVSSPSAATLAASSTPTWAYWVIGVLVAILAFVIWLLSGLLDFVGSLFSGLRWR